jgi:DNA-binding MarR family transcriptional regulator
MMDTATRRVGSRTGVWRREPFAATGSAGRQVLPRTEEERQRAQQLDALVSELSGSIATAALRLEILRCLDQFGPRLVREIPHAWPVTRQHVRSMVSRLIEDGLLAIAGNGTPGAPRPLRLTEEGARVLEEIDWNETIRLADKERVR